MISHRLYLQTPPSPIVPQMATPPVVPQENPLGVRRLLWENGFSRGILMASIEVGRREPGSYGISLGFERWDNTSHCRTFKQFLQHTADLVMFEKVTPAPDHSFRSPYHTMHSTRRLLMLTVYSYRHCDALGCVAALSFFQS
jgi:hypothetical protein